MVNEEELVENLFKFFLIFAGVPDIKYPQIEPLNVPSLIIGEGTGPVNVKQHFTDLNIHGLVGSKVISFK